MKISLNFLPLKRELTTRILAVVALSVFLITGGCSDTNTIEKDAPGPLQVLFLGHDSEHHNSARYAPILTAALATEGIHFTYTEEVDALNPENLAKYDALMIYANHTEITDAQEQALLDYVAAGHGFLPIHAASYCFQNSPEYIALVGAQFESHGTGTFTAEITNSQHPVTQGLEPFETWDETYVHTRHNEDRTVLMERVTEDHTEPWTWVRRHGEGRVFYTAYGHDERTWNKPGFQELLKNAIVWSVSEEARSDWEEFSGTIPQLTYEPRPNIPNYEERDPAPQYQFPLSPEESKKLIQVPVGFDLQLFASEPDVINPISIDWDAQGRMWVIEAIDYPNTVREEPGTGKDRIKILEDTDGDGRADTFTVFADSLNLATSLAFVNGGVVVSQAPHFIFMKDTDGDDKADVRKRIFSGWGTFDTHAGPSNLVYGFDNKIWGSVGYSGFEGEINGESYEFGSGYYRFTTDFDDIEFEFLTRTSNNTWGLGFNETFDVFGSTANSEHSNYMGIPLRYYEDYEWPEEVERGERWTAGNEQIDGHYFMHPITEKVRQVDSWGGFTAAAGLHFYTARQFPKKYWNRVAFVNEPTGHLVHRAVIEGDGAGYEEHDGWNMFAGADEWVAPVETKVGPDGGLWVADWYNFIIQHNPTPTEERGGYDAEEGEGNAYVNPLRDHTRGRIWHITYQDSEPYEPVSLSKDDPQELLETLTHDNMFWRLTAQRLLVERGETDVLEELYALVENTEVGEIGLNTAAQHALWTIHGLGALDGSNEEAIEVAVEALEHPAAGVRKAAIKVLPRTGQINQALTEAGVLHDPDPHTQLAAILAAADMEPSAEIGQILYELSRNEEVMEDEWRNQAVTIASAQHEAGFNQAASRAQASLRNETAGEQEPAGEAQVIRIGTVKGELRFDITEFEVKAGEPVKIIFENTGFMQHNLLVLKPGTLEKVGAAADELATDLDAAEQQYIPDMPEVLHATDLVNPGGTVTLTFTAPEDPGSYPYICTFPSHWRSMQGMMKVTGDSLTANL